MCIGIHISLLGAVNYNSGPIDRGQGEYINLRSTPPLSLSVASAVCIIYDKMAGTRVREAQQLSPNTRIKQFATFIFINNTLPCSIDFLCVVYVRMEEENVDEPQDKFLDSSYQLRCKRSLHLNIYYHLRIYHEMFIFCIFYGLNLFFIPNT